MPSGERFMERYHPLKELAPRDVVSRSIVMELRASEDPSAFLDLTHLPAGFVRERFPRIYQTCLQYGVDLEKHACSRSAGRALRHGRRANRSVWTHQRSRACLRRAKWPAPAFMAPTAWPAIRCWKRVVFGARAGQAMQTAFARTPAQSHVRRRRIVPAISERELRAIAWNACGILRNGPELAAAHKQIQSRQL